jgi:hypothetical protein
MRFTNCAVTVIFFHHILTASQSERWVSERRHPGIPGILSTRLVVSQRTAAIPSAQTIFMNIPAVQDGWKKLGFTSPWNKQ